MYSPHKITSDVWKYFLGNRHVFNPSVRLNRNVVLQEMAKIKAKSVEPSPSTSSTPPNSCPPTISIETKNLRRSARKKYTCYYTDFIEDDTSQSNSEADTRAIIKNRRKTCSWDTDEPYNPNNTKMNNKRRKTICRELDIKTKATRKRNKSSKVENTENDCPLSPVFVRQCIKQDISTQKEVQLGRDNLLSPVFERQNIKPVASTQLEVPSFKSQSLFPFKDPMIELSWTEKMLTAPPTNFGKIQQRRKTLLSSPLLTFQNSPADVRDLDTNSNDSVILVSSDKTREEPSTSKTNCREIGVKPSLKEKCCSKKNKADKKQKLKNIDKSEGQLFKKLKGGESPPSISNKQENEPSIELAVLGFKRLQLKTNEPEEDPQKQIASCLKSSSKDNVPSIKKRKSISFKQPLEERKEIERIKKSKKSTLISANTPAQSSLVEEPKSSQEDDLLITRNPVEKEKSSSDNFQKIRKRRQSRFHETPKAETPLSTDASNLSENFQKIRKRRQSRNQEFANSCEPSLQNPVNLLFPVKNSKDDKKLKSHSKPRSKHPKTTDTKTVKHKKSSSDSSNKLKVEPLFSIPSTLHKHDKPRKKSRKNVPGLCRIDILNEILGTPTISHHHHKQMKQKFKNLNERPPSSAIRPHVELVNELIGPPTPPQIPVNQNDDSANVDLAMSPEAFREFNLQRTLDNFEMLTENSEHHNRITHRRNTTTDGGGPSNDAHNDRILTRRLSTVPDDNGVSSTVDIEEAMTTTPMTSPVGGIEDRTPPTPNL